MPSLLNRAICILAKLGKRADPFDRRPLHQLLFFNNFYQFNNFLIGWTSKTQSNSISKVCLEIRTTRQSQVRPLEFSMGAAGSWLAQKYIKSFEVTSY